MMMDIMAPVTILSQFLQTENVDVALAKVKLDFTISDLQIMKESMNSPDMAALQQDIAGNVCERQNHMVERIYTLSYYHHQMGSVNHCPVFKVRSWNNGMRCMSLHILTTSTLDLENLCIRFIDQLVDNMHARFPDTSLLASFGSSEPLAHRLPQSWRIESLW